MTSGENQTSRRDKCTRLVRSVLGLMVAEVPRHDAKRVIREAVTAFPLLRWLDQAEAEQEAMAVFEGRGYRPLLPAEVQWRHWNGIEELAALTRRVCNLGKGWL